QTACAKDGSGGCSGDAFVATLDPLGAKLLFATYLGGSAADEGRSIAVDTTGTVYLAGTTSSVDFPTANPVQSAAGGGGDAFVAKLTGVVSLGAIRNAPLNPAVAACTNNFTGPSGGSWGTAGNWSGGVPVSTDVACIPSGITVLLNTAL